MSKEARLRELVRQALADPSYKEESKEILKKINLTEKELEDTFVRYDLNIFDYENEIYESLPMRAVLYLKYQMKNSWHVDRQKAVFEQISFVCSKSIVDMGFGVPSLYVREYVLTSKGVSLLLSDLYESAITFSKTLLQIWKPGWGKQVSFKKLDMNDHPYPGDFDLYIFQDSLEHVGNANKYLNKIVNKSPRHSKFLFSLPIGPKLPIHTISWNVVEEARNWLTGSGLAVIKENSVHLNPEGDLWAEQLNYEFFNWVVLCEKR